MRKHASLLLAATFAVTAIMPVTSANAFPGAVKGGQVETTSNVTLVAQPQSKKQVAQKFKRTKVRFVTDQAPGTVIVDTNNKFLYYVEGNNRATRYGIGVGRVEDEHRPLGRGAPQLGTHRLELGPVASGEGDPHVRGCVLGQVEGGEPTDESGGAEEDEVVVAGRSHAPNLGEIGRRIAAGVVAPTSCVH